MSTVTGEKPVPILYLDLDWTVRYPRNGGTFINRAADVAVFPEAVTMMRRWKDGGGRIIGVSNQGGIALGHLTRVDCVAAMRRTNELADKLFDKIAWCMHHPRAPHPEMARCWCRKPAPGLLITASLSLADRCEGEIYPPYMALMVGDRAEDEECARIASIDFQWATEWRAQAS